MKLPFKVTLDRSGIEVTWGGPKRDWYWWSFYFWEADRRWVYDGKLYRNRRIGFEREWYDRPFVQVKLWFWTVVYSTHWTIPPKNFRSAPAETWDEKLYRWMEREDT